MLTHLVCIFLLAGLTHECSPPDRSMSPDQYAFVNATGVNPKSYLYIGGLFGVHFKGDSVNSCGVVRERGIHNLEAFLWAVRTFKNRYPGTLEGVNVGALSFDSCSDSFHLLQQFANFQQCLIGYGVPSINPATVMAYVGPGNNKEAERLAAYIGSRGPPIVSHAATSSELSNKPSYPHFMRTVPSNTDQVQAIVEILKTKSWKYVQLIYSGDTYGRTGRDTFLATVVKFDICVTNDKEVPLDSDETILESTLSSLLANHQTRAIVVFANQAVSHAVLQAAKRQNARGHFVWFGTTEWATTPSITEGVEDITEGAVTLRLRTTVPPEFRDDFDNLLPNQNNNNPWFKEYWGEKFQCYFSDIPNPNGYARLCDDISASLEDSEIDSYVPYTIQAVDAILLGIDQARKDVCQLLSDGLCQELIKDDRWQIVFENIIKLKRNTLNVFNTSTGDPLTSIYDVYNYRQGSGSCNGHCYEKIGEYRTGKGGLDLQEANIHTYNILGDRLYGATSTCSQTPCTACGETSVLTTASVSDLTPDRPGGPGSGSVQQSMVQLRSEPWVIPLIVLACVGVLLVIILDIIILSKIFRTSYMKHWRTMWLGQLLLAGILLSYLTLFAFILTPTNATCGIIRFGVGVSYAMCFSVLLVKLLIVLNSETIDSLNGVFQGLMFFFAWGVQIAIDTEWLILKMPGVSTSENSQELVCQNGNFQAHVQSLVYVMFLIFMCTILAIKTHNIVSNHREGVFIGICAGFTIPIWLVWILLGILFGGSSFHDPCLAFGLFATATLLLFVMFLPKVRQLNSMGVEGIYAEDDKVDYANGVIKLASIPEATSNIPTAVPSVIGYAPAKASSVVGYAPAKSGSVIGYAPAKSASVIGYAPAKSASVVGYTAEVASEGSVILMSNGQMSREGARTKTNHPVGQYPLVLRHPANMQRNSETASIQSAPLGPTYMVRHPRQQPAHRENIYATTRVLRMTNDLTGRVPATERRTHSEVNYNVAYASKQAEKGNQQTGSDIYRPTHTVADLGSL